MTESTFIKIIREVIEPKGVRIFGSKETKLHALARQYSSGSVDINSALETLQSIFADDFVLERHSYAEIEKRLKRS